MQVKTQDSTFKPVIITLQTQEEVDLLVALLECNAIADYAKGIFAVWRNELSPYANEESVVEICEDFNRQHEENLE